MKKRGLSHYRSLAKKVVPKKTIRKIKNVKEKEDQLSLYKHSMKSYLEMRQHAVEKLLRSHGVKHDLFELIVKERLLNIKLKYFYLTHDKKDLKESIKLLKELEAELKVLR